MPTPRVASRAYAAESRGLSRRMPGGRLGRTGPSPGGKPEVMTWLKALPILVLCVFFDAVRAFFNLFWFFGPQLVASGTNMWVSGILGGGAIARGAGAVAGAATGVISARYGYAVFIILGTILAIATAVLGFLVIALLLALFNPRIYGTTMGNKLLLLLGFGIGATPLIGGLPGMTGATVRMYYVQIKHDKAALKRWQTERERGEQDEHAAFALRVAGRRVELSQARQAARDEADAANDNNVIPETARRTA